ncbi:T9SS type A sorting domain-containing protein [bacterium]|jgi:hypothetical protein|nr:T9SS type A sorting domain-containing protein [bacterium]
MKNFLIFVLLIAAASSASAEQISYSDSDGPHGISMLRSGSNSISINFSLSDWSIDNTEVGQTQMQSINSTGIMLPNDAGSPNLPGWSKWIAIPNGATASARIISSRSEVVENIDVAPAGRIPREDEDGLPEPVPNQAIYNNNALYPVSPVIVSETKTVRGVQMVLIGISPFQFNPVTKELVVNRDMEIEVSFFGGDGEFGQQRLRSRWWDPIIKNMVINPGALPVVEYTVPTGSRTEDFEYLIIVPDSPLFVAWGDSIANFRNQQGIRTGVKTIAEVGGNMSTAIESYIDNAYNTWDVPPSGILLIGDYATGGGLGIISPTWDSYCTSDNFYADVDEDGLPEIAISRITANDQLQLETTINKILDYERNPPTEYSFYNEPVMAGGWQRERWFVLCEEVVYGFLANELGKSPTREYAIYSGATDIWSSATNTSAVTNYFGPSGLGYIPATPAHLTDWGANATRINNDINNGTFMVQHRDHGDVTGWGEPSYSNSDLNGLSNTELTFVFSINCLTGLYSGSTECFAEAFHRMDQGALGIIAASEVSYSFVNDTFVWGMYDQIWPDFDPGNGLDGDHEFLPSFAMASGKHYLEASSWPYNTNNKEVTYYLFHHNGGAFSNVYTEVPQNLTVAHDAAILSGLTFFNVTADPGALIGLSHNGEYLGAATGTGYPVSIPIASQLPGELLTVTVTKQNFYRYSTDIQVIPPEGSYIVYNALEILDDDLNGQLDYDESAALSVTVHNVGLETSTNPTAVLTCADPYITIDDNSCIFDNIVPDGLITTASAFGITLAANVPDGHIIPFTLVVTDDNGTYESYFTITAHAAVLERDGFVINDADGILDPGETSDFVITLANTGTSATDELTIDLTNGDEWTTVNTAPFIIPPIAGGETVEVTFSVTGNSEAAIGTPTSLLLHVTSYYIDFNDTIQFTIALVIEDFESGNFFGMPWAMGGSADWEITTASPYEGTYCAVSGSITDGQNSDLVLEAQVLADGMLSFQYKVDSESSYDFLAFYLDGSEVASWSGSVGWSLFEFPVTAGNHTFTWSYYKDSSVSSGADCGWIDEIIFPAVGEPGMPEIVITPLEITETIAVTDTVATVITLSNIGAGDMNYTAVLALDLPGREVFETPQYKKGVEDPNRGQPQARNQGGPDLFGYTWIDSNEPNGPTYSWVDISGVGEELGHDDDASYGPYNLGFTFTYYGIDYDQIRVCTNGFVSFTSSSTAYSNAQIPSSGDPNDAIFLFWDDLNPGEGTGRILIYSDVANDRFVIQFNKVEHYGGGSPETFECILNADGSIINQYQLVSDAGDCTVGIENLTGTDGLQVAYNAFYVQSGLAVKFAATPPPAVLLSLSSNSGIVVPGASDELELTIDGTANGAGTFNGSITISCNDPENLETVIPITVVVTDGGMASINGLPTAFSLKAAYPNPFNPSTTLQFAVPTATHVSLSIFDLAGRRVTELVSAEYPAGQHSVVWNGMNDKNQQVASGAYYFKMTAGNFTQTRKMVLVK